MKAEMAPVPNAHKTPEDFPQPKRLALIVSKGTLDQAYPPPRDGDNRGERGLGSGDLLHLLRSRYRAQGPDAQAVGQLGRQPGHASSHEVPLHIPTLVGALPGMKTAATKMVKSWISKANLASIPELLESARELGIRMYACNTTLNVMGVSKEDLIDGVEFAGAPAFLDFAGDSDVQLFI